MEAYLYAPHGNCGITVALGILTSATHASAHEEISQVMERIGVAPSGGRFRGTRVLVKATGAGILSRFTPVRYSRNSPVLVWATISAR